MTAYEYFQRYCNIETLFIGSMLDILHDSSMFQGLVAVIFIMIFLGLLSDLWKFFKQKITEDKKRIRKKCNERNGVVTAHPENGHRHHQQTLLPANV